MLTMPPREKGKGNLANAVDEVLAKSGIKVPAKEGSLEDVVKGEKLGETYKSGGDTDAERNNYGITKNPAYGVKVGVDYGVFNVSGSRRTTQDTNDVRVRNISTQSIEEFAGMEIYRETKGGIDTYAIRQSPKDKNQDSKRSIAYHNKIGEGIIYTDPKNREGYLPQIRNPLEEITYLPLTVLVGGTMAFGLSSKAPTKSKASASKK